MSTEDIVLTVKNISKFLANPRREKMKRFYSYCTIPTSSRDLIAVRIYHVTWKMSLPKIAGSITFWRVIQVTYSDCSAVYDSPVINQKTNSPYLIPYLSCNTNDVNFDIKTVSPRA